MRHVRKFMFGTLAIFVIFIMAALASLSGCIAGRNRPVATVEHRVAADRRSDTAIILLPGFGDDPDEFVTNGFVAAVREAGIAADIIAADAYASYYFGGTAQERLYKDVVAPTQKAGYRRIWLVGVSMGGFGALWTAEREPGPITGIVLFAPFGGRKKVLKKIAAVGVDAWEPGADAGTWDHELWRWLKTAGDEGSTVPPIWLAFGESDTGYATTLLQQIVPKDHVYTRPGDHDWDVWTPLWKAMLPAIPWTGAAEPSPEGAESSPASAESSTVEG
jgi:pimeloyl-ACP methyl ester carboxylesterase